MGKVMPFFMLSRVLVFFTCFVKAFPPEYTKVQDDIYTESAS